MSKVAQFDGSTSYDLGPGFFSNAADAGGAPFCMSSAKWIMLQSFFNDVVNLPSNVDALAAKMGPGAPKDMSDFNKLVAAYTILQTHGHTFTSTIYDQIVDLGSDIFNYALNVPQYFGPTGLQSLIDQLTAVPQPTGDALKLLMSEVKAFFDQMVADIKAGSFIQKAKDVKTALQSLITLLESDLTTLGTDSPASGYWKYYNDEYGSTSDTVSTLNTQIAALKARLKPLEDEYAHDVIVAATAAAYVWIYPVGTIAAAIVAGVYGADATATKNAIDAVIASISSLEDKEKADVALMADLNTVTASINDLSGHLKTALGILEGIEGNWNSISNDLSALSTMMAGDVSHALALILNVKLGAVINAWQNVQNEAQTYRNNAYITVQG